MSRKKPTLWEAVKKEQQKPNFQEHRERFINGMKSKYIIVLRPIFHK